MGLRRLVVRCGVERLGLDVVEIADGIRLVGQLDTGEPHMGMSVVGEAAVVRREEYTDYWRTPSERPDLGGPR